MRCFCEAGWICEAHSDRPWPHDDSRAVTKGRAELTVPQEAGDPEEGAPIVLSLIELVVEVVTEWWLWFRDPPQKGRGRRGARNAPSVER